MPYAPGVTDRRGEFLGRGIERFAGSIGNALERFAKEKEEREKEEKFQLGLKKALRPRWKEMGFESEAEYDNADTKSVVGMAKGAIESQAISSHEQNRQLTAEKLAQLKESRAGQAGFNRRVSEFMRAPYDVQPPMAGQPRQLTPELLSQFAAESNLAPEDMYRVSQALENFSQAGGEGVTFSEDPATGMRFAQLRRQLLPSGMNPAKGSYERIIDPDTGEPIPGVIRGPRGEVRNLPADRSATQKKASVDATVDAIKMLQEIDRDIDAYHSRSERAKRDPQNVKAYPESRLKDLMKRRAKLEELVGGEEETRGTRESAKDGNDPRDQKLIEEANDAIRRAAERGADITEAVRKRLKEKYGITLK